MTMRPRTPSTQAPAPPRTATRSAATVSVSAALVAAFALLSACDVDPTPARSASSARDAIHAHPVLSADTLMRIASSAPATPANARDQELLAQILETRERFFEALPADSVLNEMELVFASTARLHDLADLYFEAIERADEPSPLRSRLAWVYQRLGMITAAEQEAARCLAERPDDARCHFVHGFLVAQRADAPARLAQVRDAFRRVLELDPSFLGPGGIGPDQLREQIRLLDARLALDHDHEAP